METFGSIFTNSAISTVIVGIVAMIVRSWFTDLKAQLDKVEKAQENKYMDYNNKFFELSEKISKVMDLCLEKFSSWEDRLKDTIGELVNMAENKDFDGEYKKTAREKITDMNLKVNGDFQKLKNDIGSILGDIEELNLMVKSTKSKASFDFQTLTDRLMQIQVKMESNVNDLAYQVENTSSMMRHNYKLMIHFNNEMKEVKKRLTYGKVVLSEKNSNNK